MNNYISKLVLTLMMSLIPAFAQDSPGEYDCNNPTPGDQYAVCVCKCYNDYKIKFKQCKTEACIGVLKILLTSCVSACSKYEVSSGSGNEDGFTGGDGFDGYWDKSPRQGKKDL
ncbi:MAG: hypothetical protein HY014_09405 [Acidobacteria bacterium]|nr:hypothetical protein [Acidobacteriota bacterium]MBI3488371.1 hypothetical protein [Acidobacteriota bacterium]